jgi:hypothetical protein
LLALLSVLFLLSALSLLLKVPLTMDLPPLRLFWRLF